MFGLHLLLTSIPLISGFPIFIKGAVSVGLTAFLVAGAYSPVRKTWREEQAVKFDGDLIATSELHAPAGYYIMEWGTKVSFKIPITLTTPITILGDKLTCVMSNDEFNVTTQVRDRQGNLIVEVRDNHWHVSNVQNVSWDKNYSKDSLEVLDGRGRVILQLRVFTDGLLIQGEWYNQDGQGIRIVQSPNPTANSAASMDIFPPQGNPLRDTELIRPIFKYPSRRHWGELATTPQ